MSAPNEISMNRQYQDKNGSYMLPNDEPEHDRLDAQSKGLLALMHNKPFHATVNNPKRILDIGCGTGAMTYFLAMRFPDAEVIGLDISPVPEHYEKVPNLSYVQGDIWKIVSVFGPDGKIISDKWWHEPMYKGDCEKLGLDPAVGKKLASLMRGAGLAEVKEIEYPVPIYPSDDLPENQKLIAKLMHGMAWTDGYQRMLMEKISGPTREKDELEKMIKSAEDAYHSIQPGWRSKFFVAVGQKAS